jgi:hypothetical protein
MKVLILPNPDKKPFHKFERVIETSPDGTQETTVPETQLTRAPGTKYTIMAPYSRKGDINTGALLEEIDNPYVSLVSYRTPQWEAYLKGKPTVLRQYVLEYKHGREPGFYTNSIPQIANPKKDMDKIPFFQTADATWNLNDGVTVLDMDNWKDELLYYIIPALPQIANSFTERNHESVFYLAGEAEEEERKSRKLKQVDIAIAKLTEIDALQDETIIDFAKVLIPSLRGIGRDKAYAEISRYIRLGKDMLMDFMSNYKMWEDMGTRKRFYAKVKAGDYQAARVIIKRGNTYQWTPPRSQDTGVQPETVVWDRYDDVLDFLSDVRYQPEHEEMKKQYEFKLTY